MNAFNIYEAAFDSAQADNIPTGRDELISYVDDYAFNALDKSVSRHVAAKIADAHLSYKGLDEEGGEYENDFWHKVRTPLEAIEV